jgi:cytochrome c-type biogenesis protein
MHADVTYLAALVAGLVSFLSPCVLPLVPPYLVFLAGTSLERFADKNPNPASNAKPSPPQHCLFWVFPRCL